MMWDGVHTATTVLLTWIESFVMPTFAFVSGVMTAQGADQLNDRRLFGGLKLVGIYLMANIAFMLFWKYFPGVQEKEFAVAFTGYGGTESLAYDANTFIAVAIFPPFVHIWYMVALPIWRLAGWVQQEPTKAAPWVACA